MSLLIRTNKLIFKTSELNDSEQISIIQKLAKPFDKPKINKNEIHFDGFKYFRLIDSGNLKIMFSKDKLEIKTQLNFHYSFCLICCILILNITVNFDKINILALGFVICIAVFIFSILFSKWLLNRIIENVMKNNYK